jgi:hypothetical protein
VAQPSRLANALKDSYAENADWADGVRIAVEALRAGSGNGSGDQPALGASRRRRKVVGLGITTSQQAGFE